MFFKQKILIKNLIFIFNFLVVLLIEIPKCLYLVFLNNKKKIFYQEEGGFGHLIVTPMFLSNKYENDWEYNGRLTAHLFGAVSSLHAL